MNIIFSKYSAKKGSVTNFTSSTSNSSTSSSSSGSDYKDVEITDLNRILWGNRDTGDDLNETMWVSGNIHLGEYEITYEEDEDGDEDEEAPILPTDDGSSGNLFASGKIEADSTYGKTVYLDYPKRDDKKTDLLDILKDFDGRITTNKTNIENLTNRVYQCELDIDNLESKVITIEGDITNIKNDITTINGYITSINGSITNINTKITEIENNITNVGGSALTESDVRAIVQTMLPQEDDNALVILAAGSLNRKQTGSIFTWAFSGKTNGKVNVTVTQVNYGLMTVELTSNSPTTYNAPTLYSCQIIQAESDDTKDLTKGTIGNRNSGAHWFESRINSNKIYLREFHQSDGNNDSWGSNDWNEASGGVYSVQILIIGTQSKKSL